MKYLFNVFHFISVCYISINLIVVAETEKPKKLSLLGLLPMTGSGWTGGGACLPAVQMALRHVNQRSGLLDDYSLTYSWADSQCNAGIATYRMFEHLQQPPTKHMLLCCGCSIESEATAQVSHLFNITQVAFGSSSPILSDRNRFPNFFRLAGPDQNLNPAKVALMKKFNWKKVATINQALEFFSVVIDDFVKSVKETDITIISQEIFQHDPLTRIENLKKKDARIIITASYEDKARLILCDATQERQSERCVQDLSHQEYTAYKVGLYGPKVVWIFYGWYSFEFWRHKLDSVPCTQEEMETAADGAFTVGYYARNQDETGIMELTVSEFESQLKEEETYDPSKKAFEQISAKCYDNIWVAALTLNCTDNYLKEEGYPKSLDEFTYKDLYINDIILSCAGNVSMKGIAGSIHFEQGADPVKNVRIQRIQARERVDVGTYIVDEEPRHFVWFEGRLKWKDGNIPRDSTLILQEEVSIPVSLYALLTVLAGLGILTAIGFFIFNIIYRENKMVKLSSPNINNILLLGCVLTYLTVFMKPTNMVTSHVCKARTYCFCLGFTLAFGALFSKTWRVYKIFTNKQLRKMSIKDYQLFGIVCALVGVLIIIIIIWEAVGPQRLITKALNSEAFLEENDAEVHFYVHICYSEYSLYFGWIFYILGGALLTFGAFLAWESRHVKFEALNDSRQIGVCIYNVVVLSAVGMTLTLLLEDQVVKLYGIISGCVLIGTTTTQVIVFVPKIVAVHRKIDPTSANTTEGPLSKSTKLSTSTRLTTASGNPHVSSEGSPTPLKADARPSQQRS